MMLKLIVLTLTLAIAAAVKYDPLYHEVFTWRDTLDSKRYRLKDGDDAIDKYDDITDKLEDIVEGKLPSAIKKFKMEARNQEPVELWEAAVGNYSRLGKVLPKALYYTKVVRKHIEKTLDVDKIKKDVNIFLDVQLQISEMNVRTMYDSAGYAQAAFLNLILARPKKESVVRKELGRVWEFLDELKKFTRKFLKFIKKINF